MLRVPTSFCPICHDEPDFDLWYEPKSGSWFAVAQCKKHNNIKLKMPAETPIIDFVQQWEEFCADKRKKKGARGDGDARNS